MKKLIAVLCWIGMTGVPVFAQQLDLAVGGGTPSSPGSSGSVNLANFTPSLRGGTYVGFGGDALFSRRFGVQTEVNWRASQGSYAGQLPYRPLFWDFNAIYVQRLRKHVAAETLGGIGAESVRFYEGTYNCDYYGSCSNYVSSTHFMADVGGGIRFYPYGNLFVRPEARLYFVHNNVEFSSAYVTRYGVSVGYTFGGSK